MDGQPSLWEASDACLEDFVADQRETARATPVVDILDIIHVSGYVWKAAKAFYRAQGASGGICPGSAACGSCVARWRGWSRACGGWPANAACKGAALKEVRTACNYFENNAQRMRYDEYLRAGYPIASGVIEGACRHVIKDRMEHGGMRWTLDGAQAMLNVRSVCASSEWENSTAGGKRNRPNACIPTSS